MKNNFFDQNLIFNCVCCAHFWSTFRSFNRNFSFYLRKIELVLDCRINIKNYIFCLNIEWELSRRHKSTSKTFSIVFMNFWIQNLIKSFGCEKEDQFKTYNKSLYKMEFQNWSKIFFLAPSSCPTTVGNGLRLNQYKIGNCLMISEDITKVPPLLRFLEKLKGGGSFSYFSKNFQHVLESS